MSATLTLAVLGYTSDFLREFDEDDLGAATPCSVVRRNTLHDTVTQVRAVYSWSLAQSEFCSNPPATN